jgi:hypothetical protein
MRPGIGTGGFRQALTEEFIRELGDIFAAE